MTIFVARARAGRWLAASALCGALSTLAAPAAAQTDQSGNTLEEVVVTAQRRSERLVDVPITVTAVSGERLEASGVTATAQLNQVVPAFRLDYNGAFAQPAIRGVSTALANVGGGSAVGIYVDGFYNASPLTTDFDLLNVTNIQVLKGPQGTLFGRNTTGGAVLVTTTEPQATPTLRARASYARFNAFDGGLYASSGNDRAAIDLAALYRRGDGFMTDLTNGDKKIGKYETSAIRLGVKVNLNDTDYLLVRYAYSRRIDPMSVDWSVYQQDDGRFQTVGVLVPGAIWGRDSRHMASDPGFKPFFGSTTHTGQVTGKFDLGFATLTSYTQYRDERSKHDIEVDNTNLPLFRVSFNNEDRLRTQEFLLNSKSGGRLDWVAGVFVMDQTAGQPDFTIETPPLGYQYTTHINIRSYAGFLDATYHATDQLFLTVGGRYSYEKDRGFWSCAPIALAAGVCPNIGRVDVEGHWTNFSPRFVARYQLAEGSNVYASYTRGFKAGLMNVNGFQTDPIAPEKITSYEAGYKYARGRTRLDASAFYYDYKNLQVSSYVGTKSLTSNAATSKVYGGEVNLSQRITHELTVTAGMAYTHGRYTKYLTAPANVFDFTTGAFDNSPANASHNHMQRSPDWTGNLSADYVTPLAGGELALNGNAYYTSTIYFDPTNHQKQKPYALVNLRATWSPPGEHWSFGVFGDNVTNTKYKTQVLPNGLSAAVSWGTPATYGATIAYRY